MAGNCRLMGGIESMPIRLKCTKCSKQNEFVDELEGKWQYCVACDIPLFVRRPSIFRSKIVIVLLVVLLLVVIGLTITFLIEPKYLDAVKDFFVLWKKKLLGQRVR